MATARANEKCASPGAYGGDGTGGTDARKVLRREAGPAEPGRYSELGGGRSHAYGDAGGGGSGESGRSAGAPAGLSAGEEAGGGAASREGEGCAPALAGNTGEREDVPFVSETGEIAPGPRGTRNVEERGVADGGASSADSTDSGLYHAVGDFSSVGTKCS